MTILPGFHGSMGYGRKACNGRFLFQGHKMISVKKQGKYKVVKIGLSGPVGEAIIKGIKTGGPPGGLLNRGPRIPA
jgi:hypothetical protein